MSSRREVYLTESDSASSTREPALLDKPAARERATLPAARLPSRCHPLAQWAHRLSRRALPEATPAERQTWRADNDLEAPRAAQLWRLLAALAPFLSSALGEPLTQGLKVPSYCLHDPESVPVTTGCIGNGNPLWTGSVRAARADA